MAASEGGRRSRKASEGRGGDNAGSAGAAQEIGKEGDADKQTSDEEKRDPKNNEPAGRCFVIDRVTFKNVLRGSSLRKVRTFSNILSSI